MQKPNITEVAREIISYLTDHHDADHLHASPRRTGTATEKHQDYEHESTDIRPEAEIGRAVPGRGRYCGCLERGKPETIIETFILPFRIIHIFDMFAQRVHLRLEVIAIGVFGWLQFANIQKAGHKNSNGNYYTGVKNELPVA